ncbi:MAG: WecB/TagA/CpsF family glycosyltransferase [Bacteroidota bacterium]|nr:WecB/TagA/CpsF family glycosyltransferase [Bacteroidota bacterium]
MNAGTCDNLEHAAVLGVRLDLADVAVFHRAWDRAIVLRQRVTVTAPHFHILLDAARDPDLRIFLNSCSCNHIDGIGVWLAVRFLTGRSPARLTGTDTMLPWLERLSVERRRVYVLGGSYETADTLQSRFSMRAPDATFRCHHGEIHIDDRSVLEDIRDFRPDVLLVSLGMRLQFTWLRLHRQSLEVPVVVATGGFVEFLAGTRPRAPRWMRRAGLEWLHRLLHEPGRLWRRYILGIPAFFYLVLRQRLRGRL